MKEYYGLPIQKAIQHRTAISDGLAKMERMLALFSKITLNVTDYRLGKEHGGVRIDENVKIRMRSRIMELIYDFNKVLSDTSNHEKELQAQVEEDQLEEGNYYTEHETAEAKRAEQYQAMDFDNDPWEGKYRTHLERMTQTWLGDLNIQLISNIPSPSDT